MKSFIFLVLCSFFLGCSGPKVVEQNTNSANAPQRAEKLQTTTAHTTENQQPPVSNSSGSTNGKWSQSGDPIDTRTFDAKIAAAEKSLKAKPADADAKKALAEAYFNRGVALTEARQYASALGDYRRAVKLDPSNDDAKKWINQIIGIYEMMKKEYPKEGEEPPPLPFKSA